MRDPQFETLDGISRGRETMAQQRRPVDIGRYDHRQAVTGRREQISDIEARRMRLRMLELDALR